mmetsp:Transcript_5719/g.8586  ORF Transcript_5719/g.8586 Transcript_5719/m.8586 type:complete len:111 (-) Transcript_5719:30-362(-)
MPALLLSPRINNYMMLNHHASSDERKRQEDQTNHHCRNQHCPEVQRTTTPAPHPPLPSALSPRHRAWNVITSAVAPSDHRQHKIPTSTFDAGSEVFMPDLGSNKFNITLL